MYQLKRMHNIFEQPATALWVYVYVVIILLVLSWIGASVGSTFDQDGTMRFRGSLGFLLVAILLGVLVYFLVAANIQQWAWFVALLPTALLLCLVSSSHSLESLDQ